MDSSLQKQAAVDPGWFGESLHCKSSGDTRSHWCKPMGQVLHNYFQQKWKALFTLQRREKDKGSFSLNKTIMGWGIRSREAEISASRLARYERGNWLRPRPHVSGDFCIRKFFYADTKISASTRSVYESYTTVHTYPIRIRTSQRISQQSMRIKTGSDTVTSAYTKIYGYERPHVSGYTAYTEISTLESVYRNLRIHRAYTADTCGR